MSQIPSVIFTTVIVLLAVFQVLLIAGLPLGEFAWGGQHKVLPKKLRIGSISSIFIYVLFLAIFLSKTGGVNLIQDGLLLNVLFVIMTIYSGLGILMNFISRSKKERLVMTPVAFILFVCCLGVITIG